MTEYRSDRHKLDEILDIVRRFLDSETVRTAEEELEHIHEICEAPILSESFAAMMIGNFGTDGDTKISEWVQREIGF